MCSSLAILDELQCLLCNQSISVHLVIKHLTVIEISSGQLQRGATAFQLCVAEGPLLCFIQLYDLPERGGQWYYRPLYPP